MQIPEEYLQRLAAAGLRVFPNNIPSDHTTFPGGCAIEKPKGIGGNSDPALERDVWLGPVPIVSLAEDWEDWLAVDAPGLILHADPRRRPGEVRWVVTYSEHIGPLKPPEFSNDFASLEEAIADVLDFYFGCRDRIEACAKAASERRVEPLW